MFAVDETFTGRRTLVRRSEHLMNVDSLPHLPIPEPQLRACLAVLRVACLRARLLGYEGQKSGLSPERAELLADLMDAVHNVPYLVTRELSFHESLLRGMLAAFDQKWPNSGVALLATYDAAAKAA